MIQTRFIYSTPIIAGSLIDDEHLKNEIRNIFFEVFPNLTDSSFDWKKHQREYENWDSFAQLHLVSLAEAKFSISLNVDETTSINSAQDLLNHVKSHL